MSIPEATPDTISSLDVNGRKTISLRDLGIDYGISPHTSELRIKTYSERLSENQGISVYIDSDLRIASRTYPRNSSVLCASSALDSWMI